MRHILLARIIKSYYSWFPHVFDFDALQTHAMVVIYTVEEDFQCLLDREMLGAYRRFGTRGCKKNSATAGDRTPVV
jgi:hypothetical protein